MTDTPEDLDSSITPASLRAHAEYVRRIGQLSSARDLETEADRLEKKNARVSLAEHLAEAYVLGMRGQGAPTTAWSALDDYSKSCHREGVRALLRALTQLDSVSKDARREMGVEKIVNELTEALRLTVEYVGYDTLPAIEGYSWFVAMKRYAPEVAERMEKEYANHRARPLGDDVDSSDGYCTCYPEQRGSTLSCGIAAHREKAARDAGLLPPETDENPYTVPRSEVVEQVARSLALFKYGPDRTWSGMYAGTRENLLVQANAFLYMIEAFRR